MSHRTTLTLLFVLLFPGLAGASPLSVPSWFISDAGDPCAIFSAWKSLSTREAAVYLGAGWNVLGGQLVDEQGNPLAAALRVLVLDQREQPVNAEVMLRSEEDAQLSNVQQSVGKFGFWALGAEPFRIRIQAAGFADYLSDPIQLEPGELRLVRIVLTPKP